MNTSLDFPDTKDYNRIYKTMKEQLSRVGVKESKSRNKLHC